MLMKLTPEYILYAHPDGQRARGAVQGDDRQHGPGYERGSGNGSRRNKVWRRHGMLPLAFLSGDYFAV